MNILLLGNYSGLGSTLKEGLIELGENPILAANGDGWKKIPGADLSLYNNSYRNIFDRFIHFGIQPRFDSRFHGYDVVQCPGSDIFLWYAGEKPFKKIFADNDKVFFNSAGTDYFLYCAWKNKKYKYNYYMYDNNPETCWWSNGKSLASKMMNSRCKYVMHKADGIIPVVPYEYELPYKDFPNLRKPIFLPVNTDKIKYKPNVVHDGKVVIFHGINRVKDKGSDYIKEAMNIIQKRYPDDVECIVAERMPYNDYLNAISKANIIIDQCKSFGYGINACISLAQGKIVLSGAEKLVVQNMKGDCPVINIRPDVNQIVYELEELIKKKNDFEELGFNSRKYVEENHNYIKIAQQYLDEWKK